MLPAGLLSEPCRTLDLLIWGPVLFPKPVRFANLQWGYEARSIEMAHASVVQPVALLFRVKLTRGGHLADSGPIAWGNDPTWGKEGSLKNILLYNRDTAATRRTIKDIGRQTIVAWPLPFYLISLLNKNNVFVRP